MRLYLAGPMSGIPWFNVPLFNEVTAVLRGMGHEVISPVELDAVHGLDASKYESGDPAEVFRDTGQTWGDMLARDVKMIADGDVDSIVTLPGWTRSKGARLEVFVALQKNLQVHEWGPRLSLRVSKNEAMEKMSTGMEEL